MCFLQPKENGTQRIAQMSQHSLFIFSCFPQLDEEQNQPTFDHLVRDVHGIINSPLDEFSVGRRQRVEERMKGVVSQ